MVAASARWEQSMRDAIRTAEELCRFVGLDPSIALQSSFGSGQFPVFVTREYAARIKRGAMEDPLLRQVLPLAEEGIIDDTFTDDPLAERGAERAPGILQKYHGRALMVTHGTCAVHCRYCFRRHYPYGDLPKGESSWNESITSLASDPTLDEVLLSGGDPLTLGDDRLGQRIAAIERIAHVQRLRIHTRLPIMIPARVTLALIDRLANSRLTVWMVIHCNHANELDEPTLAALGRLIDRGIPVLNQAVLLRGVNDSVEALEDLSRRLVNHRIQPYYLHQLDPVAGATHFEVPIAVGQRLVETLRGRLPGYAMPQYVIERPGETSKRPLA
jgi:EF-P beta-lysylation protein EpmB